MDLNNEINTNNVYNILLGLFCSIECKNRGGNCLCPDQSECFDRCNLLSHLRNCDSFHHCGYPRCVSTATVMKHYLNCKQQNCPCFRFGNKNEANVFLQTVKDILLKNQFLIWRRKISPFRRHLILMITKYLVGLCVDNDNNENKSEVENIFNYLQRFEEDVFAKSTGISSYLTCITHKCSDFLRQKMLDKKSHQLRYERDFIVDASIDGDGSVTRKIYEMLRQYSTDVIYDKLSVIKVKSGHDGESGASEYKDTQHNQLEEAVQSHDSVESRHIKINTENRSENISLKSFEIAPAVTLKLECEQQSMEQANNGVTDEETKININPKNECQSNDRFTCLDRDQGEKKHGNKNESIEDHQEQKDLVTFKSIINQESSSDNSTPTPPKSFPSIKGSPESLSNSNNELIKLWSKTEILDLFLPLHRRICEDKDSEAFLYPVDWKTLSLFDYPTIITHPMDLSTIRNKLSLGSYDQPWKVIIDFWLMFNNAWLYNKKSSRVYKSCSNLVKLFENLADTIMRSVGLCCGRDYIYLPQVLICCTPKMCSINRDALYYCINNDEEADGGKLVPSLANDKYVCCEKCFCDNQDDTVELMIAESTSTIVKVEKSIFTKLKNNIKEKEEFVKCRRCHRQWHRICAGHVDEIWRSGFYCKSCDSYRDHPKQHNTFTAVNLPHCELSKHIELHLDSWRLKQKDDVPKVFIRVLSVSEKTVEVRPEMKRAFVETGEMADVLPYRLKAIFAFQQHRDGSEICLFGMHTQEYSSDCPDPNSRRVYLAYLDSVHYFEPQNLRTEFYHRILISYFDYCRKLGFVFAHIWACPPGEGDDYIFHMHPPSQKLPKPKRLQEWYISMLDVAMKEGCIVDYNDIFSYAFDSQLSSVPELPYFEGDYWPTVLEDFLKEDSTGIEHFMSLNGDESPVQESVEVIKNSKKRKLKKIPSMSKRKRYMDTGDSSSDLTRRLFDLIERHKENFFVVRFYNPIEASNLSKIVDKDPLGFSELMDGRDRFLQLSRDKHLEFSSLRRAIFSTVVLCYELHLELRQGVIYSCNHCDMLLDDVRYTCDVCEEYELCESCAKMKKHPHNLQRFPRENESDVIQTDVKVKNSEDQAERFKKISIVFEHSWVCRDANCRVKSCITIKQLIRHVETCSVGVKKGCRKCMLAAQFQVRHLRLCVNSNCQISFCVQKRRISKTGPSNHQNRLMRKAMERRRMDTATAVPRTTPTTPNQPMSFLDINPYKNEMNIIHKYIDQWKKEPGMTDARLRMQLQQLIKSDIRYQEAYDNDSAKKREQQRHMPGSQNSIMTYNQPRQPIYQQLQYQLNQPTHYKPQIYQQSQQPQRLIFLQPPLSSNPQLYYQQHPNLSQYSNTHFNNNFKPA